MTTQARSSKTRSITLTAGQQDWLERQATRLGTTVSEIIRRIIDQRRDSWLEISAGKTEHSYFPNNVALGDHAARRREIARMKLAENGAEILRRYWVNRAGTNGPQPVDPIFRPPQSAVSLARNYGIPIGQMRRFILSNRPKRPL